MKAAALAALVAGLLLGAVASGAFNRGQGEVRRDIIELRRAAPSSSPTPDDRGHGDPERVKMHVSEETLDDHRGHREDSSGPGSGGPATTVPAAPQTTTTIRTDNSGKGSVNSGKGSSNSGGGGEED